MDYNIYMGNYIKTYLVYTLEDCLAARAFEPPKALASVKAYTKVGAQAALYAAIKDGELDAEVNIEECHFIDISDHKEIISHETHEFHNVQVPNWG